MPRQPNHFNPLPPIATKLLPFEILIRRVCNVKAILKDMIQDNDMVKLAPTRALGVGLGVRFLAALRGSPAATAPLSQDADIGAYWN